MYLYSDLAIKEQALARFSPCLLEIDDPANAGAFCSRLSSAVPRNSATRNDRNF